VDLQDGTLTNIAICVVLPLMVHSREDVLIKTCNIPSSVWVNPLHQVLLKCGQVPVWGLTCIQQIMSQLSIVINRFTLILRFSSAVHLVKFAIPDASSIDDITDPHENGCTDVNLAFSFRLQSVGNESEPGLVS